jgi:hypothetical protein
MHKDELIETKDKIISTTVKFAAGADGWYSAKAIKEDTVTLIATLSQILKID